MERVETLCEQLKNQIAQKATITELLQTVQMIQSELLHLESQSEKQVPSEGIALHIPSLFEHIYNPPAENEKQEEKIVVNLEVDEKEIEEELEKIKKNAELRNLSSFKNRPTVFFDPEEEIPTLSQQKKNVPPVVEEQNSNPLSDSKEEPKIIQELNLPQDHLSLNEKLSRASKEVSDTLQEGTIKDLRKGIPINDRFLFINELFKGDEVAFERSIKTINAFSIYPEAEFWIKRELKLKLGWDEKLPVVKQFDQLVKRRFSVK